MTRLKTCNFFIKHSESNVFMKTLRFLFSTVRLKSPINIILSYILVLNSEVEISH